MGALHAGHMALVAEARRRADPVVASIFVNPTQFGPNEDLAAIRAARSRCGDARTSRVRPALGAAVATMYPDGLCDQRPVARRQRGAWTAPRGPAISTASPPWSPSCSTRSAPDIALFGEKDCQQLAVIRRMVRDLDLAVEIVGVPTQREADGLALSSRNAYLSRGAARRGGASAARPGRCAAALAGGGDVPRRSSGRTSQAPDSTVDYAALADAESLRRWTR